MIENKKEKEEKRKGEKIKLNNLIKIYKLLTLFLFQISNLMQF